MSAALETSQPIRVSPETAQHYRFHQAHAHLAKPFGSGTFGATAEAFARMFGTPGYLISQTVIVLGWIALNGLGKVTFDPFPFILLNLVFSLQAAYAAPLILLAQTRQASRDKALTEADALHREDLARASEERQVLAGRHTEEVMRLVQMNLDLTRLTRELSERIEGLTCEIHGHLLAHRIVAAVPGKPSDPGAASSLPR